jgi:hypothetical protein
VLASALVPALCLGLVGVAWAYFLTLRAVPPDRNAEPETASFDVPTVRIRIGAVSRDLPATTHHHHARVRHQFEAWRGLANAAHFHAINEHAALLARLAQHTAELRRALAGEPATAPAAPTRLYAKLFDLHRDDRDFSVLIPTGSTL